MEGKEVQGPLSFTVGELISGLASPPPCVEEQAGWRLSASACTGFSEAARHNASALTERRMEHLLNYLSRKDGAVLDGRKNFPPARMGKALS